MGVFPFVFFNLLPAHCFCSSTLQEICAKAGITMQNTMNIRKSLGGDLYSVDPPPTNLKVRRFREAKHGVKSSL